LVVFHEQSVHQSLQIDIQLVTEVVSLLAWYPKELRVWAPAVPARKTARHASVDTGVRSYQTVTLGEFGGAGAPAPHAEIQGTELGKIRFKEEKKRSDKYKIRDDLIPRSDKEKIRALCSVAGRVP
jgi:hypothetical protein